MNAHPAHISAVASHTAFLWPPSAERRHNRPGTEASIDAHNCDSLVSLCPLDSCGLALDRARSAETAAQCHRSPDSEATESEHHACASHPKPPLPVNVHRTPVKHHSEPCTARQRPHPARAIVGDSSGSSTASICSCMYAAEHPQKCGNSSLVRT